MIKIKKTGEGYYLANLTVHTETLENSDCRILSQELTPYIKPHRVVSVNIKGVESVSVGGLSILRKVKALAETKKCKLRFINAEPMVAQKLSVARSVPNTKIEHK